MTTECIPMARPGIGDRDVDAIVNALRSGVLSQGPYLVAFQRFHRRYRGVERRRYRLRDAAADGSRRTPRGSC